MFSLQLLGQTKVSQEPKFTDMVSGQLANGMHYYIKHNEEPKGQASFYFAQNVGSILENDQQQGLAHFLEHMAFNGTENFKGKAMLKYLEKHGVTFGSEINAFTSFDETVYNINSVPVNNEQLIDSVLLVLHDWSGSLSLTDEEIDNERGVIHEEWRSSNTASSRVNIQKWTQGFLRGSKYAERLPIGKMDIVKNFKYKELRDYYKRWYRPDQQAVIVVGDIDEKVIEEKIKKTFSSIPLKPNLPERPTFEVPINKEPIYIVATDKELAEPSIEYTIKRTTVKRSILDQMNHDVVSLLSGIILKNRFSELILNENSSAMYLGVSTSEFVRPLEVTSLTVLPKKGKLLDAFEFWINRVEESYRFWSHASRIR